MNKSELIKALSDETNISFDGDRIEIRGFGSFKIKNYGAYHGRNPKTGESVSVIPKRLPFFRAGKELKEFINN